MKLLLSTVERRKKSAYCLYSTWFIVNVFSAIFVCDIHICIALSFLLLFSSQNWTQSSHQKKIRHRIELAIFAEKVPTTSQYSYRTTHHWFIVAFCECERARAFFFSLVFVTYSFKIDCTDRLRPPFVYF